MSGFLLAVAIAMSTMRVAMPVVTTMGFMQHFHVFEFMTLARNESD